MFRKAGTACELSVRYVWGRFVTSVVQAWVCKTHMQNSGFRPNCWCLKFSLCLIQDIAKSQAESVSETLLPLIPHTLNWFLLGQLLALYTLGAIYQEEICSWREDRDSVRSLILNAVFILRWFKSCSKKSDISHALSAKWGYSGFIAFCCVTTEFGVLLWAWCLLLWFRDTSVSPFFSEFCVPTSFHRKQ